MWLLKMHEEHRGISMGKAWNWPPSATPSLVWGRACDREVLACGQPTCIDTGLLPLMCDGQMLLKMDCDNEPAQLFQVNLRRRTASHAGRRDVPGKAVRATDRQQQSWSKEAELGEELSDEVLALQLGYDSFSIEVYDWRRPSALWWLLLVMLKNG